MAAIDSRLFFVKQGPAKRCFAGLFLPEIAGSGLEIGERKPI